MPVKTKGWTPEARARQAEHCRRVQPSAAATGPKTERGKAASSQNAVKHGRYDSETETIKTFLRWQKATLKSLDKPL